MRIAVLVVAALLAVPAPAAAQTPSGKELREAYPLHPAPETTVAPETEATTRGREAPIAPGATVPAAATPTPEPPSPAPSRTSLQLAMVGLLAVLAIAAGGTLAIRRRRPLEPPMELARPDPRPPEPDRRWTAEVQWHDSRFRVVAEGLILAESRPLEWPPSTPAAVQELADTAEALETTMIAAGWSPAAPGEAWYAKRFAWEPMTDDLWRCEIAWHAGYVSSRFEAVAYRPGRRRGRTIGTSGTFKWLLMGEPDPESPEYHEHVGNLATALKAEGWEPAGHGERWWAERFVWRGNGAPPKRVEIER
jgi:hypothetical protein